VTAVETTTETLVRSFELPLADCWDGRTLDTRIVPYNQSAQVADPPHFEPYTEMFLPGSFQRQLTTPGRDKVLLNFEHEQGIRGVIGRSLRFHDTDDGLHGSFGVDENSDGDKALSMIRDGFLTGLSLEFRALSSRRVDGVTQRVRAHLDKVSLCRYPAYDDARVLAVREEPPDPPVPARFVLERDQRTDERMAALGFEPLDGDGMDAAALAAAARTLGRSRLAPGEKAAEARLLIRQHRRAGVEPPRWLVALGRS
jgi:HK97 family phage prohead protease